MGAQGGPYLVYSGCENDWKVTNWTDELRDGNLEDLLLLEKKVRNVTVNFGPQHPAAHGVLRLILELEGEVSTRRVVGVSESLRFYIVIFYRP